MESLPINEQTKALDFITDFLRDAGGAQRNFLPAMYLAFNQAKVSDNWQPLSKLWTIANGKKGARIRKVEPNKLTYAAPMKRLMQHVLQGYKPKFDDRAEYGTNWEKHGNVGFNDTALQRIKDMIDHDLDHTTKHFKEAFPSLTEKKQKAQDELIKAKAQSLKKWAEENDIPLSVLIHALDAKPTNTVKPGEEPSF